MAAFVAAAARFRSPRRFAVRPASLELPDPRERAGSTFRRVEPLNCGSGRHLSTGIGQAPFCRRATRTGLEPATTGSTVVQYPAAYQAFTSAFSGVHCNSHRCNATLQSIALNCGNCGTVCERPTCKRAEYPFGLYSNCSVRPQPPDPSTEKFIGSIRTGAGMWAVIERREDRRHDHDDVVAGACGRSQRRSGSTSTTVAGGLDHRSRRRRTAT